MATIATTTTVQRIHFWQHGRAVREILRAYAPGTDTIVDQMRSAAPLKRFVLQYMYAPLYFAREQGWTVRGKHGEIAAILYLRREQRAGVRVMHVDEISVSPRFRRAGLAQQLLGLAEDLARAERRPFLKLAVTVANTPAVTLYRRLGYQELHHHYFSLVPATAADAPAAPGGVALRSVRGHEARATLQRFYRMEMEAGVPALTEVMATYYAPRAPKHATKAYAVEHGGQRIGCGCARRAGTQWVLTLCLRPELWGTETEQDAIRLLARTVPPGTATSIAIIVSCTAHHEKLRAVSARWTNDFVLEERSEDRMLMVKCPWRA